MQTDIVSTLLYKKTSYFILGGKSEEEILSNCAEALNNNMSIIQFNPVNCDLISVKIGHKIRQLCSIYDSLYIVKSRCDIATITEANGVLLSDKDIKIEDARKILSHETLVLTDYLSDTADIVLYDKHVENIKNLFVKEKENIYLRV